MISHNLKLLIALIIAGTIAVYIVVVIVPSQLARRSYDGAKKLGEDFRKAFQFTPEISVNNTIVLHQQTPVLELSVMTQNFEHRYVWVHSWLGSTKKIYITGTFDAKVGFDLHRKFSIKLQDEKAIISLPDPITLSVESRGDIEYRDENGIWNWIDIRDRTAATNAFIVDVRRFAEKAAFVKEGKKNMEARIQELLRPYASEVSVRYTTSVKLR